MISYIVLKKVLFFRECLSFVDPNQNKRDSIQNTNGNKLGGYGNTKNGQYLIGEKELYVGQMVKGLPQGMGVIVNIAEKTAENFPLIYEGEVRNCKYNGKGKFYKDGILYEEGKFTEGVISEGVRYYDSESEKGAIYAGFFSRGQRHGKGRMVLPNGFFYSGTWKDDRISGDIEAYWSEKPSKVREGDFFLFNDAVVIKREKAMIKFLNNGNIFVGEVDTTSGEVGKGVWYFFDERTLLFDMQGEEFAYYPSITREDEKYKKFRLYEKK